MPTFAIIAHDRPGQAGLRAGTRPRHLDHLRTLGDRLLRAGPLLDEAGEACGTLLLADFPDLATARAFAAGDPYRAAGLFERVTVTGWRQALPEPPAPDG